MYQYKRIKKNGIFSDEHRRVWVEHYGEIPKGYIVHHINGNKTDNRIDNLEIMTRKEHCLLHGADKNLEKGRGVGHGFKKGNVPHNHSGKKHELAYAVAKMIENQHRICQIVETLNVSRYFVNDVKRKKCYSDVWELM